ncbi:hypothetical protein EVAR_82105_1 [Eumeta japonica]|uniref:Uncharacterized protein n=1 Tax=Eumeta variegata TaxID=151549 RepID=A0A4C1U1P5_EUMVA|nr:hypothetical protein EVAR_82105_1 [Eumeta japonica]
MVPNFKLAGPIDLEKICWDRRTHRQTPNDVFAMVEPYLATEQKWNDSIMSESSGGSFPPALPHTPSINLSSIKYHIPSQEASNALMTPLGLRSSIGGDSHLPSDGAPARVPFKYVTKMWSCFIDSCLNRHTIRHQCLMRSSSQQTTDGCILEFIL